MRRLRELVPKHTVAPYWSVQLKRMTREHVDWKAIGAEMGRLHRSCMSKHRNTKDRVILLPGGSAGRSVSGGGVDGGSVDGTQSVDSGDKEEGEVGLTSAAVLKEMSAKSKKRPMETRTRSSATGTSSGSSAGEATVPPPQQQTVTASGSSSSSRVAAPTQASAGGSTAVVASSRSTSSPAKFDSWRAEKDADGDSDSFYTAGSGDDDSIERTKQVDESDSEGEVEVDEEVEEQGTRATRSSGAASKKRMSWTPELVSFPFFFPFCCFVLSWRQT